jgi:hypothetical protein
MTEPLRFQANIETALVFIEGADQEIDMGV